MKPKPPLHPTLAEYRKRKTHQPIIPLKEGGYKINYGFYNEVYGYETVNTLEEAVTKLRPWIESELRKTTKYLETLTYSLNLIDEGIWIRKTF